MAKRKQVLNVWLMINRYQSNQQFEAVKQEALTIFKDMLTNNNYGDGVNSFHINIDIEPIVNYGHHHDWSDPKTVGISCNIDFEAFTSVEHSGKVSLVLNAILVMLKFWKQKLVTPIDFDLDALIGDLESYLLERSILLSSDQHQKLIIKPFDTTSFRFVCTYFGGYAEQVQPYLVEMEHYINNRLAGLTFGESVRDFMLGYEMIDFDWEGAVPFTKASAELKRYSHTYKYVLIVKQFDYRKLRQLSDQEQYQVLKDKILEAIRDIEKMSRKPRDFDRERFYDTMAVILSDYEQQRF